MKYPESKQEFQAWLDRDGLTFEQAKTEILLHALQTVHANAADHPDAIRSTIDNALNAWRCAA